ncbi:DUF5522 domain-containing protein [Ilumatobacter nonamiensis]|uniref:DUF5522 domain-containing protein n=1 Tax=Ilumatobacter nonamiensis TaxID=467093 RepID=UPI00034636F3|nr:DUF5522 domain-containing protein [Ilumatobacter nonamiensis]
MTDGEALRDEWQQPHPSRLSPDHPRFGEIAERHAAAIADNVPTYVDPVSGYSVFTARFLARRRYCCDSGCRHCPYVL